MSHMQHTYEPSCNCDSCFIIWRAEAEVEKAVARQRGELRRQERLILWEQMIAHFVDTDNPREEDDK